MGFIADRGPVCQLGPWDERTAATTAVLGVFLN